MHWGQLRHSYAALRRAHQAGVSRVLAVSADSREARNLITARRHWKGPVKIFVGWGLHPEGPPPPSSAVADWFEQIEAARATIDAIGEVGLPFYSRPTVETFRRWQSIFAELTGLADRLDLPLVIHAVHDSAAPALRMLDRQRRPALFHWLKAPPAVVDAIVQAGHYISLTPEVSWKPRDQALARQVPAAQLLVETDAPWPHGAAPSQPSDVILTYRALAALRPDVDWPRQIALNFSRYLFGPKSDRRPAEGTRPQPAREQGHGG